MPGKRYGANVAAIPPVEFELAVYRNDVEEIHQFTAKPAVDMANVTRLMDQHDLATKATAIMRMMSRLLVDNDGVPKNWTVTPLDPPKNAGPTYQAKFRGPDGRLHTLDKAGQFTDPAKGSSRRRWEHLMFEDDGIVVHMDTLIEIMQDLIEVAAERPTSASVSTGR